MHKTCCCCCLVNICMRKQRTESDLVGMNNLILPHQHFSPLPPPHPNTPNSHNSHHHGSIHGLVVCHPPHLLHSSCRYSSRHSRGQCCSHIEAEEAAAVSPQARRKEALFLFCFPVAAGRDPCQPPSEILRENTTVWQSRQLINLQTWHGSLMECYGCSYIAIIGRLSQ